MNKKIAAVSVLAIAGAAFGQYVEMGDAGDVINTGAQATPAGALTSIDGEMDWFNAGDHVDAYRIIVTDPGAFFASTDPSAGGSFIDDGGFADDSRLYLFDTAGNLVLANDDDPVSGALTSTISDPSTFGGSLFNSPGSLVAGEEYILAVTYFDNSIQDAAGERLVNFLSDFDALHGQNPAYAGGGSWTNIGDFDDAWTYRIALGGAVGIPAPGAVAMLGLGGLAAARRRR